MSVEDFPTFKVGVTHLFPVEGPPDTVLQTMMFKRNAQLNLETIQKVI